MKVLTFIKTYFLWLLIPVALYMGSFVLFPAFNIIDDGASLLVAQQLNNNLSPQNWSSTLIEQQTGRFRPMYHLSFWLLYTIFGLNPFWFWLTQALVLGGTLIGMAIFLSKVTKHYWLAALAPLLLLFFTPIAENFYRLGTAEPKQFLLFVWMLVVLSFVKEKGWSLKRGLIFGGLFVTALLLKETSIVFAGMVGFLALWQLVIERKSQPWSWLWVLILAVCIGLFFSLLPEAGSYSSGFELNLRDIWLRLLAARLDYAAVLFPVTLAGISLILRFLYQLVVRRKIAWSTFFWPTLLLTQLLLVLFVGILPWKFQLPRYYYPIYLVGLLFVITELKASLDFLKGAAFKAKLWHATLVVAVSYVIQLFAFQSAVGYGLNRSALTQYQEQYAPVLLLLLGVIAASILRMFFIKKYRSAKSKLVLADYIWPVWFIATTSVLMVLGFGFWQEQWPRNVYTFNFVILSYGVYELTQWLGLRQVVWFKKVKLGQMISLSLFAVFVVLFLNQRYLMDKGVNLAPFFDNLYQVLSESFDTHQISYAMIEKVIADTPDGTSIYVVGDDYEVVFEIGLYASKLRQRPITLYTSSQQLVDDLGKDYPYLQYTPDPVGAFLKATNPKMLLLRKQTWDVFQGQDNSTVLSPILTQYSGEADWDAYQGLELKPKASFYTIPEAANWVRVR